MVRGGGGCGGGIPERFGPDLTPLMTSVSALTSVFHLLRPKSQVEVKHIAGRGWGGGGVVWNCHPPALVVPVHDVKLSPQPPVEGRRGGGERKQKETRIKSHVDFPSRVFQQP